jgi:hypothetical protein
VTAGAVCLRPVPYPIENCLRFWTPPVTAVVADVKIVPEGRVSARLGTFRQNGRKRKTSVFSGVLSRFRGEGGYRPIAFQDRCDRPLATPPRSRGRAPPQSSRCPGGSQGADVSGEKSPEA